MLKLESARPGVPVDEMKDGDIAEVINRRGEVTYGRIVQRFGTKLITLGAEEGESFSNCFHENSSPSNFRVRIFGPGTKFILE